MAEAALLLLHHAVALEAALDSLGKACLAHRLLHAYRFGTRLDLDHRDGDLRRLRLLFLVLLDFFDGLLSPAARPLDAFLLFLFYFLLVYI